MAEFQEVMRQRARMCKSLGAVCYYCELEGVGCDGSVLENLDRVERTIMDWAADHPEPRYPTWKEWQEATFPEARNQLCINHFAAAAECKGCTACRSKPIPADIAKKLGIQPITEERVDK